MKQNSLRELGLLLQHCVYPEQVQFVNYTKYLFYKGLFLGKIGDYKNAHRYIGEALRKAPTLPEGPRQQ